MNVTPLFYSRKEIVNMKFSKTPYDDLFSSDEFDDVDDIEFDNDAMKDFKEKKIDRVQNRFDFVRDGVFDRGTPSKTFIPFYSQRNDVLHDVETSTFDEIFSDNSPIGVLSRNRRQYNLNTHQKSIIAGDYIPSVMLNDCADIIRKWFSPREVISLKHNPRINPFVEISSVTDLVKDRLINYLHDNSKQGDVSQQDMALVSFVIGFIHETVNQIIKEEFSKRLPNLHGIRGINILYNLLCDYDRIKQEFSKREINDMIVTVSDCIFRISHDISCDVFTKIIPNNGTIDKICSKFVHTMKHNVQFNLNNSNIDELCDGLKRILNAFSEVCLDVVDKPFSKIKMGEFTDDNSKVLSEYVDSIYISSVKARNTFSPDWR